LQDAIGSYYKLPDGTRVRVVGVAQNGKYGKLTEALQPAMFLRKDCRERNEISHDRILRTPIGFQRA